MKRFLSLLICTFVILSANSKVVTGHCGRYLSDSLYWSFDTSTGELTITGDGIMKDYTGESSYDVVLKKNRCDIPWYDDYRHVITSVSLPEYLPNIGSYSFYGCDNLVSISLPDNVQSIGKFAFDGTHLNSINIPNNVTSIGINAFGNGLYLPVIENVIYAGTYIVGVTDKTLSSYSIQAGTRWIGYEAFKECPNLTAITIPNTVLHIEENAFKNCANLSTISLLEGLVSIGDDAFKNSVLTNIIIPNSVTSIGQGAFRDTQLKTVTIGENASEIGMYAFACNTLQTVNWNVIRYNDTINTNTGYGTNKIITSYSSLNKGIGASNPTPFYGSSQTYGNNITSFNFGEQVQYIPKCLCEGMVGLEEITIPQSIKEINADAFFLCTNLTSIRWNAVRAKIVLKSNIGYNWNSYYSLFMGDEHPQLQSIIFGEEVESIPEYLSLSVASLTTITLGHKVNSISTFTFKNSSINTIYFTGSLQEWCSLNHSNLMLRESRMGGTSGWAEGNLYIQDIQMDSLIIPHDIANISNYSFRGCKNIHSVTLEATIPPTIGYKVFTDTLRIHVPYCAYPDYYDSNQWKEYHTRIIETPSFAINLQANDNTLGYIYISTRNCETNTITITAQPAYKCEFIRWSDDNTENPREIIVDADIELTAYFSPVGGTDIEDAYTNDIIPHKVLQDDQIYILRGDKTYTITGSEVK